MNVPAHYHHFESIRPFWRKELLILMYHAIEAPPVRYQSKYLYVSPSRFRSQLRELQQKNVRFVSLEDWKTGDDKRAVVTFDDGFENVFRHGLPVLSELKIRSINYIIADRIGQTNTWDNPRTSKTLRVMDHSQIKEWISAGQEIGSHTLTHPGLGHIPLAKAREEIFDSKKKLEDWFGVPIRHFSYPYGNCNDQVRDLVLEAGYETACLAHPGLNTPYIDRFSLLRLLAAHRWLKLAALRGAVLGARA